MDVVKGAKRREGGWSVLMVARRGEVYLVFTYLSRSGSHIANFLLPFFLNDYNSRCQSNHTSRTTVIQYFHHYGISTLEALLFKFGFGMNW